MDIAKRIKNRRIELGLTLKDVAEALGVAESTVSRYESKDISNMGIDKIEALAKVLKCSPSFLMGWELESIEIETIAAHHDGDEWTQEELDEIERFKEFVKMRKQAKNKD